MTETIQRLDCNPHVLNHRNLDLLTTPLEGEYPERDEFFDNTRLNNALRYSGTKFVGQIYSLSETQLLMKDNLGPLGLKKLKARLESEGVPFIPNALPTSIFDEIPSAPYAGVYESDAIKLRARLESAMDHELGICKDFAKSLLPPEKQAASPDFLRAIYFSVQDQLPNVGLGDVDVAEIERDFFEF